MERCLERSEAGLKEAKRVNRVLILENTLAIEQLRKLNVSGMGRAVCGTFER